MPRGRPRKTRNESDEAKQKRIEEAAVTRAATIATRKEQQVEIVSDTFTIRSGTLGWAADIGNDTIYYSRLDYLCDALMERKIRKAEVRSIQELKDEIQKARREILTSVGKVYPPAFLQGNAE